MAASNGTNYTRYLQRIGHSWYVRVKVPRSIQDVVGNTHLRKALHTRDLDEANRRKWKVVEKMKADLNRLKGLDPLNIEAEYYRRDIRKLYEKDDDLGAQVLELVVNEKAEELFERTGDGKRATEWLKLATSTEPTVDELMNTWLPDTDYSEQTKHQHRKAWEDLKIHLGGNCLPSSITDKVAVTYVEDVLKKSGKSYETNRRALNSLVAFWTWLGLRGHVARGQNVWRHFRLTKKGSSKKKKRAHTEEELIQLFSGNPVYSGLTDVMILGLYTGARLDEICSLRTQDIKRIKTPRSKSFYYLISIPKSKTQAGIRVIAVAHPHPCAVISRRIDDESSSDSTQLFSEFSPGGYDGKLSWAVSKAYGRYRDKVGLSRETDFHSFRRTLITLLENLGVDQIRIMRYVGHEVPTLAGKLYSSGSTEKTNLEVAKAIKYSRSVEKGVQTFLEKQNLESAR